MANGTKIPAHHHAEAYLDAYLEVAGIRDQKKSPLFRSVNKKRKVGANPMTSTHVFRIVKRRAREAGLPSSTCGHTFRATGITVYLENGGTIEDAQEVRSIALMNCKLPAGRTYLPVASTTSLTVEVLRFLMRLDPSVPHRRLLAPATNVRVVLRVDPITTWSSRGPS